jgi:hypothetical protein
MTDNPISLAIKGIKNPHAVPRYVHSKILGTYLPASIFMTSKFNIGKNIFESEWDCLIILDTCRPDGLEMVSTEYDFINNISTRWSVGGDSWEWMANTFDSDYIEKIKNTAYYTSNPNAITVLENHFESNHDQENIHRSKVQRLKKYGRFDLVSVDDFADYECLHREVNYSHHYPSPRALTDRGIVADRNENFDRMILHYMPPHGPYIAEASGTQGTNDKRKEIRITESPRDVTYEAYLDNLRWGLNEIKLLLDNIDRQDVVITADHGECFSSHFPSHVSGQINPTVRRVPWVRTEATDSKSYSPDIDTNENDTESPVEERLQALGYR